MTYILPVLYVIVSYTFFLLAVHFGNAITLQIVSILLPFIMGIVNLIVVLTVGRKWSRKTLLNCTLIIKYGLIPFYLIDGISSRECIENWLQCAVVARNVAAHGGRFYNRVGLNPAVKLSPKHQKEFSGTRPFGYFYAIYKLLPEDRKLSMLNDISKLFRKHPFALPKHLGFPENWQELIIE